MSQYHTPIMVKEVMEGLLVAPDKRFIDATVGGGGHLFEIVKRGGVVLGLDTDRDAIEEARGIFKESARAWRLIQGNFRNIGELAKKEGFESVDGILFDLGVSSHQLDTAARGFSYRFDEAPLDLRLNQNEGISAAEYLKHIQQEELYEILAAFSEEEHSRAIADAIVRARRVTPIVTTGDLYQIIEDVVGERQGHSVASRIFQAIRIAVNDELGGLKEGLRGAKELLRVGGRLAVISFHSLEDRIVKQFMRSGGWKLITKKPVTAGQQEVMENKRARSGKLRIAEKI